MWTINFDMINSIVTQRDLGVRGVRARGSGTHAIVEVVVDVRSSQVGRSPVGCVVECDPK